MTRRRSILIALLALVAATAVALPSPAGAATEARTYSISGTMVIGGLPLTFPAGTTFSATVDTTTGAFTDGAVSIPTIPVPTVPDPAEVDITDAAPATGTIDPSGAAAVNLSLNVALTVVTPSGGLCNINPVDISLSTGEVGGSPLTGDPPSGTLTAIGYTVPAIPTPPTAPCPDGFAYGTNGFLSLPTTETSLTATATLVSPLPSPEPTPAPGGPVTASPSFTG